MNSDMQIQESTQRAVGRILWQAGQADALEDVLQGALLNALKSQARFEGREGAQYGTWFHRIAVNKALEYRRRNWRLLTGQGTSESDTERMEPLSILDAQPDT